MRKQYLFYHCSNRYFLHYSSSSTLVCEGTNYWLLLFLKPISSSQCTPPEIIFSFEIQYDLFQKRKL
ncbi:MAG TPA: hypothetical protein DDY68_00715 [Porphyromonadaceae bacterium]|nr:hypothetical protein [Porphyromonadaceae bacterium]